MMKGKNFEGSGHAALQALYDHSLDLTEKDHDKMRVICVSTQIRTGHLPRNTPRGDVTSYVFVCNSRCYQYLP